MNLFEGDTELKINSSRKGNMAVGCGGVALLTGLTY